LNSLSDQRVFFKVLFPQHGLQGGNLCSGCTEKRRRSQSSSTERHSGAEGQGETLFSIGTHSWARWITFSWKEACSTYP